MELLHSLGVDWKLLIAQILNFAVLLAVLYKFLYKPLLKVMQERTTTIEKGIQHAKEAEIKLAQSTEAADKKIQEAQKEGQKILGGIKAEAEKMRTGLLQQAQTEADHVLSSGRAMLAHEKEETMKQARKELMNLVIEATRATLREVVTPELDKKFIETVRKHV